MVRKPTNLSDERVKVPKDYNNVDVLRAAADPPGSAAASEAKMRPAAGQGSSQSGLPAWVLTRAADRRVSSRIEREQPTTSDDFLIVSEAASILRISERTLRRLLAEGKFQHIRVGKQIRIPRKSLQAGW
jgi:excisionase family DNA binding protein